MVGQPAAGAVRAVLPGGVLGDELRCVRIDRELVLQAQRRVGDDLRGELAGLHRNTFVVRQVPGSQMLPGLELCARYQISYSLAVRAVDGNGDHAVPRQLVVNGDRRRPRVGRLRVVHGRNGLVSQVYDRVKTLDPGDVVLVSLHPRNAYLHAACRDRFINPDEHAAAASGPDDGKFFDLLPLLARAGTRMDRLRPAVSEKLERAEIREQPKALHGLFLGPGKHEPDRRIRRDRRRPDFADLVFPRTAPFALAFRDSPGAEVVGWRQVGIGRVLRFGERAASIRQVV